MTAHEELWRTLSGIFNFFDVCAVYYGLQLIRCGIFSFGFFGVVLILRKLLPQNRIFLKGSLWFLLIPVLFVGKLKFFYESESGTSIFSRLTDFCMNNTWLCRIYLLCAVIYFVLLLRKRRKLKKLILNMEKSEFEHTPVYISDIPITPFTAGVMKPKIVIPRIILEKYSSEEIQTILLHEINHIKLLHLVFYLLWDIMRVLLWINPLFMIGVKYFKEDMEKICDKVTIQKSGKNAYAYGEILLKTIKLLRSESNNFNMYAAFSGEKEFGTIKSRVKEIAGYEPYKRKNALCIFICSVLFATASIFCIKAYSFKSYSNYDVLSVYDIESQTLITEYSNVIENAVRYDEQYIYIDVNALKKLMENSGMSGREIYIFCGGYYKLPGIGAGGSCEYLQMSERITDSSATIKIDHNNSEDILCKILKFL